MDCIGTRSAPLERTTPCQRCQVLQDMLAQSRHRVALELTRRPRTGHELLIRFWVIRICRWDAVVTDDVLRNDVEPRISEIKTKNSTTARPTHAKASGVTKVALQYCLFPQPSSKTTHWHVSVEGSYRKNVCVSVVSTSLV